MMLKNTFYILVTVLFISSCKEININKEVNYTLLLDSLVLHQNELLEGIDTAKLNDCLNKTSERLSLFEIEDLNDFQKQWLYHEKIGYQKIKTNLSDFSVRLDSLNYDLAYSQKQITDLKDDLIHRHLSKEQFASYVKEEKKILGKLNAKSESLRTLFGNNISQFDSLEAKLKGIFIQLNALQSPHEKSATK